MLRKQNLVKGILFGLLALTSFTTSTPPALAMPGDSLRGEERISARPALGWLSGWGYRRTVTITNSGSTLTNYQVRIALDSTFSWSNAKSDGSDIRVTAADGTTPLPFWIENWNPTTSANIWVKVPSIPNGTTYILLYYGNSNATSASNGTNTFILFDNGWSTNLNPVHSATQSWWENSVTFPMVFRDTSISPEYHMLFDGHGQDNGTSTTDEKGYAYSSDLVNWTEYDSGSSHPPTPNPIMGPASYPGSDYYAWGDTIKVGSTYHMFTVKGPSTTQKAVHAQSTDLTNWTSTTGITTTFDTLTINNDPDGIGTGVAILKEADGITPVVVNGSYWMVYFHGGNTAAMYLAYANTSDLLTWTTANGGAPILNASSATWHAEGVWTPSFVRVNNKYYLYYQGIQSGVGWQLGFMSADAFSGGNPVSPDAATWSDSSSNPVVTKTHGWDQQGCQDPILRYFNGTYYLFYTGTGTDGYWRNGFATSSSPEGPWTQACPSDGCGPNWTKNGSPTVSNGIMSLASGQWLVSPNTYSPSPTNVVLGFRANFQQGVNAKWVGFVAHASGQPPFLVVESSGSSLILAADTGSGPSTQPLNSSYFGSFNVYEIAWLGSAARVYMNHSAIADATLSSGVSANAVPIQLANYNDGSANLNVDWVYLRQFSDQEPTVALGSEAPTVVTLSSFDAVAQPEMIQIRWKTATELGNFGFNLYRGEDLGSRTRLNETLIPAKSFGVVGADYEFDDMSAVSGKTYQYWLESLGTDGTQLYGPVTVVDSP